MPQARSYWARFFERIEPPLLVLLLEDKGLDGLAQGHDLRGVDVVADGELAHRDDALGLEADVEEHLVPVDLDDRPLDQVTVLELDDGSGHGVLEGRPTEVVFGDRTGVVDTVLVEAAHGLGRQQGGALGYDLCIGHEVGSSLSGRIHRTRSGPRRVKMGRNRCGRRSMVLHRHSTSVRRALRRRSAPLGLSP